MNKRNVLVQLIRLYPIWVLLLLALSCGAQKKTKPSTMQDSAPSPYEMTWKKIDSLTQQGLPASALTEVKQLLVKARADKQSAEIIKALIYRGRFQAELNEDGYVKAIDTLEQELNQADFPENPLLQSMLAELYNNYLESNRWQISQRTAVSGTPGNDLLTWTARDFVEKSHRLYLSSLEEKVQLKNVPLDDYGAILTKGRNNEGLRTTLYDFLAHRAIDFFSVDRNILPDPTAPFIMNQPEYLDPASNFAKLNIQSPDPNASLYRSLQILQGLIQSHLNDQDPKALIDIDLKRLKFVYDQATFAGKEAAYQKALEDLSKKYSQVPAFAEVQYELARYFQQRGQQFNPGDETGKWDWKTANEICEEAIKRFPDSYGAKQCKALQNELNQKNFSLQIGEVQVPDQPFLLSLAYRNVSKVYLKIVAWDEEKQAMLDDKNNEERPAYINQQIAFKNWSEDLPLDGDLRQHRVELKADALGLGTYLVVISDSPDFSSEKHGFSFLKIQVSRMAYWKKQTNQGATEFVVMDRESGAPLAGVEVTIYRQEYNSRKRRYEFKELGTRRSDENGIVQSNISDRNSFRLKLKKGQDQLQLEENYYVNQRREQDREYTTTHFFLDRAIYRPGQTVYFKSIPVRTDQDWKNPRILPNEKITITFLDVNYQEVAKAAGTTNEYGAFSGSFTAPKSGLLGRMTLRSNLGNAQISFRVEEYKRPKFEVSFDPVADSYRLNDSVKVTGLAKAYAGSNVDGAQVKYRVVREVRYPYWPYWRYGGYYPPPGSKSQEIANGNTVTDEQGKFTIKFNAAPDLSVNPENKPTFRFKVMADVVDITGETHSASLTTVVGYISLDASVQISDQVNADQLKSVKVVANNLNGEAQSVKGKLIIHRLQAPEVALRPRMFGVPDTFVLDKATFKQLFPRDPYKQENLVGSWPQGGEVWTSNFNTGDTTLVELPVGTLNTGYYEITLQAKDKYGVDVEWNKRFMVYKLGSEHIPDQAINLEINEQGALAPGDQASFYYGSAFESVKAFYQVELEGEMIEEKWVDINGLTNFILPIKEAYRGNVFYRFSFVRHNRSFSQTNTIQVPWSNKKLKFSYETFRDKLAPGQEEEWRIRISGPDKEQVAAEMVAAMYDASLDAFAPNSWSWNLWTNNRMQVQMNPAGFRGRNGQLIANEWNNYDSAPYRAYRNLEWFGFNYPHRFAVMRNRAQVEVLSDVAMAPSPETAELEEISVQGNGDLPQKSTDGIAAKSSGLSADESDAKDENAEQLSPTPPAIRTNLNETVFFFPTLKTDAKGDVILSFTMNEALTRWKFLGMAYTKDLKSAFTEKEVLTQKDLMVLPNPPRFFREDDQIEFTAKVSNLSEQDLTGEADLQLLNALTNEPVNDLLGNNKASVPFTVKAGQSARLAWKLTIPVGKVPALTHRVIARAGNFSDGEESTTPVLTNRMLVTETMPLPIRGNSEKTFTFTAMQKASESNTLQHHRYTLEFTSNPAWYAVQALPYIMEYPHECTEQVFNRYYANALATSVANAHPKVKQVFEQWKNTDAMLSNLAKNQELKSALLEETPWVLAAQNEAQQKKNIGLLFDLNRMADEQQSALNKLAERQLSNGGFAWFPGGRDNWYITQYLVEGMGHLNQLGVSTNGVQAAANVQAQAVQYIDDRLAEHYKELQESVKRNKGKMDDDHLDYIAIHYLYTRSFYNNIPQQASTKKATEYYVGQAEKYWVDKGSYGQGMIGLALNRMDRRKTPAKIIQSLNERAMRNEELGMYWKLPGGYFWYDHPVETQALMVELYEEVAKDAKSVEELKIWLLKNKQTTHWKTTKATANAVYALLKSGDNWLLEDQPVAITIGNKELNPDDYEREAGTGYFKTHWDGEAITKDMAKVKLNNPNKSIAWGGIYWQYFEQLDKIKTFEETPLTLKKALFREENTNSGPVLKPVGEGVQLEPGDKLTVRIELRVDRAMEYVHMKDMRASGFEPLNVLSSYKWQDGLGYYESTRDVATHFFFSYLPRGTYVFEYPLRVVHQGNFSNGITTIQCMYAPEFTSHSEGVRVTVE